MNTFTSTFDRVARVYDHPLLQRVAYRAPQNEVIAQLRKVAARSIVDVGCGTGILAARIADELEVDAVFGVDPSAGMLAEARVRSTAVQWRCEAAENLPLEDGSVDAVVTTTAFHFFDQPAALAEFHRVLAPGGVLVISTVIPWIRVPFITTPSAADLGRLLRASDFTVLEQRPVSRPMPIPLIPDVLTVAKKV